MACFSAPLMESLVVKAVEVHEKKKETEASGQTLQTPAIPLSRKLKWLTNLLWGGSALLLFEHIWHGEIVPWVPFLTAMLDPADTVEMLQEIATVGVSMCVLITGVWAVMCKVADAIVKRPAEEARNTTIS